jgi:hypothetical protein
MPTQRKDGTKKPSTPSTSAPGATHLDPASFGFAGTVLSGYLTPTQLATQLGCCEKTLHRWDAARIGPPRVHVGRKVMYRREAVTQWLIARERGFDSDGKRLRGQR